MTSRPDARRGAAARGLAAAIAKEAARVGGVFCTLRTFSPCAPAAPWETFGLVHGAAGARPLWFVSDHGVMRTASVLVAGARGADDRFESPKGPLLAPELGALVARSAAALGVARPERPTVLDAAVAILDAARASGAGDVRCTVLGRWEGVLGARFDVSTEVEARPLGPLCFVWQRADALTVAFATRSAAGRLVVPTDEAPLHALAELPAVAHRAAQAMAALRGRG